jgi:hypothetical protein
VILAISLRSRCACDCCYGSEGCSDLQEDDLRRGCRAVDGRSKVTATGPHARHRWCA